jgi:hypothetical protein
MFTTRLSRLAFLVAAVLLATAGAVDLARAGSVTLGDFHERRLEALANVPRDPEDPGETVDERVLTRDGVGSFSGTAEASIGTRQGSGNVTATIESLIAEDRYDFSGTAQLQSSDAGNASARFFLDSRFIVTDPVRFNLAGDVFTPADPTGPPSSTVRVGLIRGSDTGGQGTVILTLNEAFGPGDADGEQFTRSVLLQSGEYFLDYEVALSAGQADGPLSPRFDLDLTFGDANPIPLPPAAWAALATLGSWGAAGALRRARARRRS